MVSVLTSFFTSLSPLLSIVLIGIVICCVIHYKIYVRQIKTWKQSNIPFSSPTFLIGHKYFSSIGRQSHTLALNRIYRENFDKDLIGFFMTTIPIILLRNPKLIPRVFSKSFNKAFLTGFGTHYDDEELENMITTATNQEVWKSGRTALAPIFASTKMSIAEFTKLKRQIDKLLNYSEKVRLIGKPLNVIEVFQNFAIDYSSLRFYGEDTNSYSKKEEVHQLITSFFEPTYARMFSIFAPLFFPCLRIFNSFKLISRKNIDTMTKLLSRKMADRDAQGASENDFIDHLRMLRDKSTETNGSENKNVNLRQMVGFGLILAIAGTNTVQILAVFAAHLLSLHPEYQKRIRKEIAEAMERHNVYDFTPEVVNDLQFTEQCLMETQRMYPILQPITRVCSEDFRIPGTEYYLRKGDIVIIDPYSAHRDPKFYKHPEKFDPDRFSPESRSSIPPECFLSFGFGPRKCPGRQIGLFVGKSLIAALLHRYELRPESHLQQMEPKDFNPKTVTVQPKADVFIHLIPWDK